MIDDAPTAQIAYRWFHVLDDGTLAGAQNVVWPEDSPLHAEHVASASTAERTLLRVFTAILAACTAGVVICAGWAVGLYVDNGIRYGWNETVRQAAIAGAGLALLLGIAAVAAGILCNALPRRLGHTCPTPQGRFVGRGLPACGIYSYRTLDQALTAAAKETTAAQATVIARVYVWGRVYPHTHGF